LALRVRLLIDHQRQITRLDSEERAVTRELAALVKRSGSTLDSLCGLSTRSVAELLVEIGDPRRFTTPGFARFNASPPIPAPTPPPTRGAPGAPAPPPPPPGGNPPRHPRPPPLARPPAALRPPPQSALRNPPPPRPHKPRAPPHPQTPPLRRHPPPHAPRPHH